MKPGKFLAACLFACSLASAESDEVKSPLLPKEGEAVLLFLLDNSASLPPLDPELQRREAIEKIYGFLSGQPYRLVLFGGRKEIHIDAPQEYRNSGQWTDFYFAFDATQRLIAEYPAGTEFKMILITDGKIDPSPEDWADQQVPPDADLKSFGGDRTIDLLSQIRQPLYVIVIGKDIDLPLIKRMVVASSGDIAASEYAQGIADFFADDGMLLRRFIFRVEENEGLAKIEPVVTRIAAPANPRLELYIAGSLLIAIGMLIGVGVRSYPGAGDREVVELRNGEAVQVAVDRLRRLSSDVPAWSWRGLSLVESSKSAVAMLTAQEDSVALPPTGFALDGLDAISQELIVLRLPELREKLEALAQRGKQGRADLRFEPRVRRERHGRTAGGAAPDELALGEEKVLGERFPPRQSASAPQREAREEAHRRLRGREDLWPEGSRAGAPAGKQDPAGPLRVPRGRAHQGRPQGLQARPQLRAGALASLFEAPGPRFPPACAPAPPKPRARRPLAPFQRSSEHHVAAAAVKSSWNGASVVVGFPDSVSAR